MRTAGFNATMRTIRLGLGGAAVAGLLSLGVGGAAVAQDIAASGNGGTGDASASGGAIVIGDINSGGNAGCGISVGDVQDGAVAVDAGSVTGGLSLSAGLDGGVGITDASGGESNFAFTAQ